VSIDGVPGVVGIHHVAIAVTDLDESLAFWTGTLGATLELRAAVPEFGVDAACIEWAGAAGAPGLHHGTLFELLAPLDESSGVARFLEKNGPGIHHVAWAVADVADALDALAGAGARLIDETPRIGLHGSPVAFVHPRSMGGVLVELVQVPPA
jgi:methylmalonyl-CoA/ethylmalonyl-CoA epimerase